MANGVLRPASSRRKTWPAKEPRPCHDERRSAAARRAGVSATESAAVSDLHDRRPDLRRAWLRGDVGQRGGRRGRRHEGRALSLHQQQGCVVLRNRHARAWIGSMRTSSRLFDRFQIPRRASRDHQPPRAPDRAGNEPWITALLDEMHALPPADRRKIEDRKRAYFDLVRGMIRELQAAGRIRRRRSDGGDLFDFRDDYLDSALVPAASTAAGRARSPPTSPRLR